MAFSRSGKSGKQARSVASGELSITNIFFTYGAAFRGIRAMKRDWIGRLGIGTLTAALVICGLLGQTQAWGADYVWNSVTLGGNSGEWSSSPTIVAPNKNFNGTTPGTGVAFGAGGVAIFNEVGKAIGTVNVTEGTISVSGMKVHGDYDFTGGAIVSTGGSRELSITGGTVTFGNEINFTSASNNKLTVTGTGTNVTFSDYVDFSASGGTLTVGGAGSSGITVTFADDFKFAGGVRLTGERDTVIITSSTGTQNDTRYSGAGTLQIGTTGTTATYLMTSNNDATGTGFTGTVDIVSGSLTLLGEGSLRTAGVQIASGQTLKIGNLTNASKTTNVGRVWGEGGIELGNNAANSLVLYSTTNGVDDFEGIISGDGNLIVGATGTGNAGDVTLIKNNTYAGLTTIANGTLTLKGDGEIAASKGVDIKSGTFDISDSSLSGSGTSVQALNGSGNVLLGNNTLTIDNSGTADANLGIYSGTISGGTGGLTLSANAATDRFTLNNDSNAYGGATTLTQGTLVLNSGRAVARSSEVITTANSTLELGVNSAVRNLSGTGGTVKLNANTLTIEQDEVNKSYGGTITGTGGLTLAATHKSNILTLSAANDYKGDTNINSGTLALTGSGSIADSRKVTVGAEGVFSSDVAATIQSLYGDGEVTLDGAILTIANGNTVASGTFGGKITNQGLGQGGLTLNTDDTFTLTGENTYTDKTTIDKGTLKLSTNGSASGSIAGSSEVAIASASDAIFDVQDVNATVNNLTGGGTVRTAGGKTLTLNAADYAGDITGAGGVDAITGTVEFKSAQSYTGDTTIKNSGTLTLSDTGSVANSQVNVQSGSELSVNNTTAAVKALSGDGGVSFGSNAALTVRGGGDFSGGISDTAGGNKGNLTLNSTEATAFGDTLTLRNNNTYTGTTTITKGTLKLVDAGALAATSSMVIDNGGIFDFQSAANDVTLAQLASASTGTGNAPRVEMGSTGKNLTITDSGSFSGVINGSGGLTFDSADGKKMTLGGANIYSGVTKIEDGELALSSTGSIESSSGVDLSAGTTSKFTLEGTGDASTIKALSGGINTSTVTLDRTLIIGDGQTDGDRGTYAGKITGAGGLTLNAHDINDKFTLASGSGSNLDYSGITNIAQGTLALSNSNTRLTNSSEIQISNTGILDLTSAGTYEMSTSKLSAANGIIKQGASDTLAIKNGKSADADLNTLKSIQGGKLVVGKNTSGDKTKLSLTGISSLDSVAVGDGGIVSIATGTEVNATNTTTGVDVQSGGELAAAGGKIVGNVKITDATFSSTNSATLDITGNFTADADSTTTLSSMSRGLAASVNASGTVTLGGDLHVDALSTGSYTLFTSGTQNGVSGTFTNTEVFVGVNEKKYILQNTGDALKLIVYSEGKTVQEWTDDSGSGLWKAEENNWKYTTPDDIAESVAWDNAGGNTAEFNMSGTRSIEVDGNQNFDTLKFTNGTYTFTDANGTAGSLVLAPAADSNNTATINLGGRTVTIDTTITDGSGTYDLRITGGGTLTLGKVNDYRNTFVESGANLILTGAGAAGSGAIDLGDSANSTANGNLGLEFTGTLTNAITGGVAGNTVTIGDGTNTHIVTLDSASSYDARTVITDGAELTTSGADILSASSIHQLNDSAKLTLVGNQTIGGLIGGDDATVAVGTNTLTVAQSSDAGGSYSGALSGSGGLIKQGAGKLTISNLDTTVTGYTGTFAATEGELYLKAKTATDMALKFGTGSVGTIVAETDDDKGITIGTVALGTGGTLAINKGTLTLDGANVLENATLDLRSGAFMSVDDDDKVNNLELNGNTITFADNSGAPYKLSVTGSLTSTNNLTTLKIDNNSFIDWTDSSLDPEDYFFEADETIQLIAADTSNVTSSNFRITGSTTDIVNSVDRDIVGGTATFISNADVKTDGVYLVQGLSAINSNSNNALPVTIDSGSPVSSPVTVNAKLTGNNFSFTGSNNITVANTNTYSGSTIVDMNSAELVAGSNNAFGNGSSTSLLDIQSGTVNINGKEIAVGAITEGSTAGDLTLGSGGGKLTISNGLGKTYSGQIDGTGDIIKNGTGSQIFSNANNNLNGGISVNAGSLKWAGAAGGVNVTGGEFIQSDSTVASVSVGDGGALSGHGSITGNLEVTGSGKYTISMNGANFAKTMVGGTATLAKDSIVFGADAMDAIRAGAASTWLIDANSFVYNGSGDPSGPFTINMGVFGSASFSTTGTQLMYDGFKGASGPDYGIGSAWGEKGVNIGGVLDHSSLGSAIYGATKKYQGKTPVTLVEQARLGSIIAMGSAQVEGYNSKAVRSMFNHESGLSATGPVEAAGDIGHTMLEQGLMNRVNNLRAARTILNNATPSGEAFGPEPAPETDSDSAYGSLVVAEDVERYSPVGAPRDPRYFSGPRVWVGGIGHWSKYDETDNGLSGYEYKAGGFMLGIDRSIGDWTLGASFGYARGDLDDTLAISSNSKIDVYSLNLYTDYNHESGINAMFFGGAEYFDNSISRRVAGYYTDGGVPALEYGKEDSDYDGYGWYLGFNLGADFLPRDNLTITPSVGLTYSEVWSEAFTRTTVRETSGAVLRDRMSDVTKRSVSLPLDVSATYDIFTKRDEKLSAIANVGYAYEFRNKGSHGSLTWADMPSAPSISFTGRAPGRSSWNLGLGARYQMGNVDFDLKYDFTKRKDFRAHRLAATVGYEF